MTLTESAYTLKKGEEAPDFSLIGTDDTTHSLSDFTNATSFLIVFMCNHCPYVQAKLAELNRIARDYKDKNLVVIGINSNDADTYTDDSFEKMKEAVSNGEIQFMYLYDETQEVAKAYNATCTPDPFLFDDKKKLVFHSRIDDPPGVDNAKKHELHEALAEFFDKGTISLEEKPSMGCNIKWK